jgi:hypothetical protein
LPGPTGGHNAGAAAWLRTEVDAHASVSAVAPKRPAPRLKALPPDFGRSNEGHLVAASLQSDASAAVRQRAIDALARTHGMPMDDAAGLAYDPNFDDRGITEDTKVRIGPKAFTGSAGWLACIVFHELLHCSQFRYYARHGLSLTLAKTEPKNTEPLRLLYAVDELECWKISELSLPVLALGDKHKIEFDHLLGLSEIEVDEAPIKALVEQSQFARARRTLMSRLVH